MLYLQQHLSLQHTQVFSVQHFDSLLLQLHFISVMTHSPIKPIYKPHHNLKALDVNQPNKK